uniref:Uncharacterized protein n=1 Tax=Coturnix japonica TaxID=93934 RepID=A0A8C2YAJ9_COTJA
SQSLWKQQYFLQNRAGKLCLQCTTDHNKNPVKHLWQAAPHPGRRFASRSQEVFVVVAGLLHETAISP